MNFFLFLLVSVSVLSNSVRGQNFTCEGILEPDDPLVTKLNFADSNVTINTLHNETDGVIRYSGEL